MHKITVLLIVMALSQKLYSQDADSVRYMDTLIAKRHAEKLNGQIPAWYSPGNRARAVTLQKAFEGAAEYYRQLYHRKFSLKLAVLDSIQWITERVPWGFLSYEHGWAAIPAHLSYANLLHIYGISDKQAQLDSLLQHDHISREELISSVYLVYSLHELGHYFIADLNKCEVPDLFANELIATYFSYHYFARIHSRDLQVLITFSKFISANFKAKYRYISDMDKLYTSMPMSNFKWFHCNIVLLAGQIQHSYREKFIHWYLAAFTKGKNQKLSTREVVAMLDRETGGLVGKWEAGLNR